MLFTVWLLNTVKIFRRRIFMLKTNHTAIILSVFVLLLYLTVCSRKQPGQHVQVVRKAITKYVGSHYLLYLPRDYNQIKKDWPLVLFLHGSGERGEDINLVKRQGPPKLVEEGKEFPFILISPQHSKNTRWSNDFLIALIDEVVETYRVDEDRIYVTGLSGGGHGTWYLATEYPNRFAAIVPICGRGIPHGASRIKHLPIWVFHGAKDQVQPIKTSEEMVAALEAVGGNVKFTVYPEAGHDAWTETYNNPELYDWLLKQRRLPREE
jgi:predicted peptidase